MNKKRLGLGHLKTAYSMKTRRSACCSACADARYHTAAINGIGMGLAATFVLVTQRVVSLLALYRPRCAYRRSW